MKTHILFPLCLFIMCSIAAVQAQAPSKTFVKSFNLKGHDVVLLDLKHPATVETWPNAIMRIQVDIELENGNHNMLRALAKAGRYHIYSKPVDGEFVVFVPGMEKEVSVGGKLLHEKIHYTVFAPENVLVRLSDEASASVSEEPVAELSSLE